LERFVQLRPKVLLVCDRYRAAGKEHDVLPKMQEVAEALKRVGLNTMIVVGQLAKDRRPRDAFLQVDGVLSVSWPDFLDKTATNLTFVRVLANTPLWVLYSSGTSEHFYFSLALAVRLC
jgi:acetoacetyl-CoA synthetase